MPIRPSFLNGKQIAEMLDPAKAGDGYFYLKGDKDTDGSWRVMVVENSIMSFQFRQDGKWGAKLAIHSDETQNYILKTEKVNDYLNMDALREALAINDGGSMDGRSPVIDVVDGFIAWQYAGDSTWRNLVAIDELKPEAIPGEDGKTPQLRVAEGELQWSIEGSNWTNIFNLQSLKPEDGSDGRSAEMRVSGGQVQWRLDGDSSWINLFAVPSNGKDATIKAGMVDTLPPESAATVNITGTGPDQVISFGIPSGRQGEPGKGEPGPANELKVGTVSAGQLGASITGTPPNQTLNLTIPPGAAGTSYSPQPMTSRTVTPGTPFQHTDVTKGYRVMVNARATQTVTVAGVVADKVELRVGPTPASVAPGGAGGSGVGIWESGITGVALMIGAAVTDGGQLSADLPAGWYFQINRISGSNSQLVSCFTQSLTP